MSKLTALAKINLGHGSSARTKSGFLSAYSNGVHSNPSLIEHALYNLVVRTLLEEDPKHTDVRERAAYVIGGMLKQHPEWANRALAEAVTNEPQSHSSLSCCGWSYLHKILNERRSDLIAGSGPEPALPAKHAAVFSPAAKAEPK